MICGTIKLVTGLSCGVICVILRLPFWYNTGVWQTRTHMHINAAKRIIAPAMRSITSDHVFCYDSCNLRHRQRRANGVIVIAIVTININLQLSSQWHSANGQKAKCLHCRRGMSDLLHVVILLVVLPLRVFTLHTGLKCCSSVRLSVCEHVSRTIVLLFTLNGGLLAALRYVLYFQSSVDDVIFWWLCVNWP